MFPVKHGRSPERIMRRLSSRQFIPEVYSGRRRKPVTLRAALAFHQSVCRAPRNSDSVPIRVFIPRRDPARLIAARARPIQVLHS
jgi:hypothetical protein